MAERQLPWQSAEDRRLVAAIKARRRAGFGGDAERAFQQLSIEAIECVLPPDWTGHSRVQHGEGFGEIQILVRRSTGPDALIRIVQGMDPAVRVLNRLNLVGALTIADDAAREAALDRLAIAYRGASPIDGALRYARAVEMWIRASPHFDDDAKSLAKDERKNLEGLAMLYETRGRTDPTEAELDLPPPYKGTTMTMTTDQTAIPSAPTVRGNKAITAEVVSELWKGVASGGNLPWQTPYFAQPQINGFTGKRYRGINRLVLAQRLDDLGGSDDNRWFARGQIMSRQNEAWNAHRRDVAEGKAAAGSKPDTMFMRKGQQAVSVVFASKKTSPAKTPSADGAQSVVDQVAAAMDAKGDADASRSYYFIKRYPVWHASQLENCPPLPKMTNYAPSDGFGTARDALMDLVKRMGAIVTENPSAVPNMVSLNKRIITPPAANFKNEYAYLSVLAHEIAHLSGTSDLLKRRFILACESGEAAMLARDKPADFERLRAQEEMVAEISATLMMACLGHAYDFEADQEIGHQHASYVAHYLEIVRDDPTAFSVACTYAERVVEFAIQTSPLFCLAAQESGHYVPEGELVLDQRAARESAVSDETIELDLADFDMVGSDGLTPLTVADFEAFGASVPAAPSARDQDSVLRDLGF